MAAKPDAGNEAFLLVDSGGKHDEAFLLVD
jgi:hypothetical protein